MRYRDGVHFAWVCEYFDAGTAPAGSAAAAIAPSSNPKHIYETLWSDVDKEDAHSALIKGYRKTFKALAMAWKAAGSITDDQAKEIIATVKSNSWKIWRPVLYVIPKSGIVPATRIHSVAHGARAAYGPELQIQDLVPAEFDVIEFRK
ncbi:MAG TPA: hypothetical protein VEA40_23335 [Ramlibacter sp.]|nr:hypothetical protein [Ramlibacter sp.]